MIDISETGGVKSDYTIALYMRLSKEDAFEKESDSITNQRSLLRHFVKEQKEFDGCRIIELYDDGYPGKKFDRPKFSELIALAREKSVNCILVKDFSRFGRDYIEVGDYLEQVFPFLGIRFISVNDHYDSEKYKEQTAGLDIAFRNFVNDFYSRDTSQKIRRSKKMLASQGAFYSPFAPYGYKKSDIDKHKLVVDPETAQIVKRIYDMRLSGYTIRKIAIQLNEEKIPSPAAILKQRNPDLHYEKWSASSTWGTHAVSKILKDERYVGNMVSYKRGSSEVYGKVSKYDSEDWLRKEGTHEPIIPKEDFLAVQKLYKSSGSHKGKGRYNPYVCGHCGRKLYREKTDAILYCRYGLVNPDAECFQRQYSKEKIEEAVFYCLQWHFEQFLDRERQYSKNAEKKDMTIEQQIAMCRKEIQKIGAEKIRIYESYRQGKLTKEHFMEQKKKCENKEMECESIISSAMSDQHEQERRESIRQLVEKYKYADRMTEDVLKTFVEKITVFSADRIHVTWAFSDVFMTSLF